MLPSCYEATTTATAPRVALRGLRPSEQGCILCRGIRMGSIGPLLWLGRLSPPPRGLGSMAGHGGAVSGWKASRTFEKTDREKGFRNLPSGCWR